MLRYLALFVLAAVSLSVLLPSRAHAQTMDTETEVETVRPKPLQSDTQVDSGSEQKGACYGYSILMTDLAALGVGTLGVAMLSSSRSSNSAGGILLVGAGLTYALGGPVVHARHGKPTTAFGSFGLRLGLPVGGALVGGLVGAGSSQGCSGDFCGLGGVVGGGLVGFVGGMVTASVIDITLLAHEDAPKSTAPRFALVPAIDPKQGSASLSVQGIW